MNSLVCARSVIEAHSLRLLRVDIIERLLQAGFGFAALAVYRSTMETESERKVVCLKIAPSALKTLVAVADLLRQSARDQGVALLVLDTGRRRFPIAQPWRNNMKASTPPAIITPSLQLAQMRLDESLIRVLLGFLERPEEVFGLVSAATEQQMALSESAARIILGADFAAMTPDAVRQKLVEATAMKREDYFWLPDLEDFRRDIRGLEPNNPDSQIILRPRMQARDGNWYEYVHQYTAVQDSWGNLYHIGRSLDMAPVATPG